jgi:signal transduction histidine kinase/DNA-binding response OmpR family regulator
MKRITIIAYSAFLVIILANVLFYRNLYRNQLEYSNKLLDRQAMIAGSDIDNTSMYIVSDLTEIDFSDDITLFFSDINVNERAKEKMKLYYSKYEDIIVGLMLYNNAGDVYTLFKDEERNLWLDGSYRAQSVPEIFPKEKLEKDRDKYKYYLPVIKDGRILGNLVVTIDFSRYFTRIFMKYNLEQYQWQWVVNDTGAIVFDNHGGDISYTELRKITERISTGTAGRLTHKMKSNAGINEILSSFYPINIFGLDFGIVFSSPTDFFQKYIIRNSAILVFGTMALVVLIILMFRFLSGKREKQVKQLAASEKSLVSIIEQMPAGIIIYNRNREIIRANRQAAGLFSYDSPEEMTGKLVPDLSRNEYLAGIEGQTGKGTIIRLPGPGGDMMIFRNSMPVVLSGEEATLEVLIDITSLELARQQEAEANVAKSELLARMSFEIRTPLNGIIGMTEMLKRADLPEESKEIARLLRRSADLLLTIINDIFDVSKVETGKMILDEIPFRLRQEVNYCVNLVKRENPESLVRFVSSVDKAVPDNLIGDPYRLRQVITNLLNNSLAGTQSGEIKLECHIITTVSNRYTLGFVLTDTGKNYTKAEIKKLFGDYITTLTERSEWAEDLKLGPILARQLVELMGGQLIAGSPAGRDESGQERGLKVSFTITVHLNEKVVKNIDLSAYRQVSDIRTLAITGSEGRDDDFLSVIHKLGLPVSVTSFQKHTISQIKSGLQSGKGRNILLIIFDEPGSDGFEVAKVLLDSGMTDEHIVLMFTSRDPRGHYARCVDMGVDHLLVKPFAAEDLYSILREHFPALSSPKTKILPDKSDMPVMLIVDDNYLNRKVVGSLLKVLGVAADYAAGGSEAIAMAKEKHYDLILMDLIMPEVDGFEAARIILESDSGIVIVALSADTMPETRARTEQTGMKELLSKPVTVEELRRVINRYHKQ